jgi:hypothetical protein
MRRIRPKFMTVATMFLGLVSIFWSIGAGAEVMKRIAAPMVGDQATSFLIRNDHLSGALRTVEIPHSTVTREYPSCRSDSQNGSCDLDFSVVIRPNFRVADQLGS